MAEIKLQKRYKYAGDIMPKLLDIGFDLETASDFLNNIPDADVVPRAEVEEMIYKLECLLCHATGSKLSKHTYDLRTMETAVTDYINESYDEGYRDAKSEVAREIFEEIEFDIHQLMFDNDEHRAIAIEGVIADLKKKYTEGGK